MCWRPNVSVRNSENGFADFLSWSNRGFAVVVVVVGAENGSCKLASSSSSTAAVRPVAIARLCATGTGIEGSLRKDLIVGRREHRDNSVEVAIVRCLKLVLTKEGYPNLSISLCGPPSPVGKESINKQLRKKYIDILQENNKSNKNLRKRRPHSIKVGS